MRTIYENYRGFKISKQESIYNAEFSDRIVFSRWQLSQVLDTVDNFVEVTENSQDRRSEDHPEPGLPQN
ncbi:hypothetical protein GCM10008018_03640 [Paenibacillus marchantiophytorum]|uniref:Transposase n=1 Tax=Paenibacillus marchantiophytorum TaxID=1619310 RepID=A0ABQ2BNB4_9BACL|nr:hypothetical protein [Paenibacillus marchantiophytorum]GGI43742.1 hypothetical protein GCM10008018_03640 [Paenibacillus marchantiophytorum]